MVRLQASEDNMYEVLLVVYLLVALALVGLVLVQHGKGASMGASFGAGASNTVFGSSGSGNFLTKSTAILAILFFVISVAAKKQKKSWEEKLKKSFIHISTTAKGM